MKPTDAKSAVFVVYTTAFGAIGMFIFTLALADEFVPLPVIFGICIAGGFSGVCIGLVAWEFAWDHIRSKTAIRARKTKLIREHVQKRMRANLKAQLNKKDFESRLDQFVSANVEPAAENTSDEEEPFVSRVPFWQREMNLERSLPKPIELIRRLLQHISKVIHGGKA